MTIVTIASATKAANKCSALAGRGRVLVRPSGTEPLVRVMVEAADAPQAERLAGSLAKLIKDVG